ncbi:MAG: PcfJ domain-containing protein [Alphaproteobacteria bacterium]|nr:PcfJ domain-containing protein [Alphaproteobacteria bacterium]
MSMAPLHADARAGARVVARSRLVERRLARFQPQVQARVRAVAALHPRLADLALSFPALLFALAVPRAGSNVARAIQHTIDGAPLKEISDILNLPLWLRAVEAGAFCEPIPELPNGELFRRQIGNYLPTDARRFERWVRAVSDADRWADQALALWVARELRRNDRKIGLEQLRGVCLWAWCSRHCVFDGVLAFERRWGPAMQFETAVDVARGWFRRVNLHMYLGDQCIEDTWLAPGVVDGYEFVALRSAADIAEEAAAMKHCVADYVDSIAHDCCRIWSMRRDGIRVATVEVGRPTEDPLPAIAQLKAAHNGIVGTEVWLIARRWLNAHDPLAISRPARAWGTVPLDRCAWRKTWRYYWLSKKCIPSWLPLTPSYDAMSQLMYGERTQRHRRQRRRR